MYKPVSVITVRPWDLDMGAVALDPRLGNYSGCHKMNIVVVINPFRMNN